MRRLAITSWTGAAIAAGLACVAEAGPAAGPGASRVELLVPPSTMHGVAGLNFDPEGRLLGSSIHGLSVYRIDVGTGAVSVVVGPPDGESDDVAAGPRGTPAEGVIAWAALRSGELRYLRPGGRPQVALTGVSRINPVAFSAAGLLYAAQAGDGDDALWELDLAGGQPPRKVLAGRGPLNGFAFGPDGRLYSPQFGTDRLVAIDVRSGEVAVVAEGVGAPAAVRVSPRGDLWHVDYKTGEVWTTPLRGGRSRVVARVREPLDSLAIAADGTVYVSNVADSNVLAIDPATGRSRALMPAAFAMPLGLAVAPRDGVPSLLAADPFGWRWVDLATGRLDRPDWAGNRNAASAIAADAGRIAWSWQRTGRVRVLDRASDQLLLDVEGLGAPRGLVLEPDGAVLVVDAAGGRLLHVAAGETRVLAQGLQEPVAIARARDGGWLVAEAGPGRVRRIGPTGGPGEIVASGLRRPTALEVLHDGRLAVVETAAGEVVAIDLRSSARTVLARGLALSLDGLDLPQDVNGGIAVGPDGAVYVACAGDNSIVRIWPRVASSARGEPQ